MKTVLFGLFLWGSLVVSATPAKPRLVKSHDSVFNTQEAMRHVLESKFVNFRPGLKSASCLIDLYRELTSLNVSLGDVVTSITVKDLHYDDGSMWMGMTVQFENPRMKTTTTVGQNYLCPTIVKWP